jgi:acyl carrier protein
MDDLRVELQTVFQDVFGDDQIVLRDETTADDVDGWDSLMNINLVISIEKHFGIKLATAEIGRLKDDGQNIGTMVALIARKLGRTPQ